VQFITWYTKPRLGLGFLSFPTVVPGVALVPTNLHLFFLSPFVLGVVLPRLNKVAPPLLDCDLAPHFCVVIGLRLVFITRSSKLPPECFLSPLELLPAGALLVATGAPITGSYLLQSVRQRLTAPTGPLVPPAPVGRLHDWIAVFFSQIGSRLLGLIWF
jgi:hypothetical protein